jgi:hypothetical protein
MLVVLALTAAPAKSRSAWQGSVALARIADGRERQLAGEAFKAIDLWLAPLRNDAHRGARTPRSPRTSASWGATRIPLRSLPEELLVALVTGEHYDRAE